MRFSVWRRGHVPCPRCPSWSNPLCSVLYHHSSPETICLVIASSGKKKWVLHIKTQLEPHTEITKSICYLCDKLTSGLGQFQSVPSHAATTVDHAFKEKGGVSEAAPSGLDFCSLTRRGQLELFSQLYTRGPAKRP